MSSACAAGVPGEHTHTSLLFLFLKGQRERRGKQKEGERDVRRRDGVCVCVRETYRRIIGGKNRIVEGAGAGDDRAQVLSSFFLQCARVGKKRRNTC